MKTKILFILILTIILFSSVLNIYEKRWKIKNKIFTQKPISKNYEMQQEEKNWASKVLKGGYVLHFRHAHREKWVDYRIYDLIEHKMYNSNGENQYFAEAICLSKRGKIQAKAIGEHIDFNKIPISEIITSPSCRARQTTELAFNKVKKISQDNNLIFLGLFNESDMRRLEGIRNSLINLIPTKNQNIVTVSHGRVLLPEIFENEVSAEELNVKEGGFVITENVDGKLFYRYKFNNFSTFARYFYNR